MSELERQNGFLTVDFKDDSQLAAINEDVTVIVAVQENTLVGYVCATSQEYSSINAPKSGKKISTSIFPSWFGDFSVIAVDLRGHGESEKVSHGYRISRLSKDIQELVCAPQLKKPHLLDHSMGCSVIWSYLNLFGSDKIDRLVLVDQSPLFILS